MKAMAQCVNQSWGVPENHGEWRLARESGERENGENGPPQRAGFPSYKLHAPRLTHVFLKLHELHLTLVPFPQELRTTQIMSTLAFWK
jgi:hypothetical protein